MLDFLRFLRLYCGSTHDGQGLPNSRLQSQTSFEGWIFINNYILTPKEFVCAALLFQESVPVSAPLRARPTWMPQSWIHHQMWRLDSAPWWPPGCPWKIARTRTRAWLVRWGPSSSFSSAVWAWASSSRKMAVFRPSSGKKQKKKRKKKLFEITVEKKASSSTTFCRTLKRNTGLVLYQHDAIAKSIKSSSTSYKKIN